MRVIEQTQTRVHVSLRVMGKDSSNQEIEVSRTDFRVDGPTITDVQVSVPETITVDVQVQPRDSIPYYLDDNNASETFNQLIGYDYRETVVADVFGEDQLINIYVKTVAGDVYNVGKIFMNCGKQRFEWINSDAYTIY